MVMGLWLHADSLDDIEITLDGDPIDDSFVAYELTNIHSTEEVEFMSMAKKIVIDADYELLFSLFGSPNVNTSPALLDTNVEWDLKVRAYAGREGWVMGNLFTESENYTIRIYDGDASDSDNFRLNTRWNVASEISPIVLEEDMENILTGQRR
jgi:hypothetical protein